MRFRSRIVASPTDGRGTTIRSVPPRPRLDPRELAAIFLGGCIGTLARAGLARALPHAPNAWPWATFAVNVAGVLLLGWAVTQLPRRGYGRSFAGTGVCGALTTFATLQLELVRMADHGCWGLALGYAAASIACGFGGIVLATSLARRARPAA
jgi:fluoride exporter